MHLKGILRGSKEVMGVSSDAIYFRLPVYGVGNYYLDYLGTIRETLEMKLQYR